MPEYLIGIDGGGSKTDFLLCGLGLNEVARHKAGRSNPNDIGIEASAALIKSGVDVLCANAGIDKSEVAAAFAGIAGASSRDYVSRLTEALGEALPGAAAEALHDGVNVLYGAFPESDGVCVICGTGSSCFVKKRGSELIRIGGYGALDMCGNGYEIGRAALAHALKTVDGREKEGALESLLHKRFGEDFLAALETMLALDKTETAALAELVFEAANAGDGAARAIIEENIGYVAGLIKRAGVWFDGEYSVALAGGVFKSPLANEILRSRLDKNVILVKSDNEPVFGAAARAREILLSDRILKAIN